VVRIIFSEIKFIKRIVLNITLNFRSELKQRVQSSERRLERGPHAWKLGSERPLPDRGIPRWHAALPVR
jgi:hypothetical protein